MKFYGTGLTVIALALTLSGCAGGGHGAGYWFHLIFVVIPIFVIGFILVKRSESMNDSLYTIEGQLKTLSGRIDGLEEKLKKLTQEPDQTEDKKTEL